MKKKHKVFEYNKITPHIYLGSNVCCFTHFSKELLSKGVEADISLEGERVDQPQGVDFYLWLPVKDHTAPTLKQLKFGVRAIDEFLKNKIKIYIHCKNGHGRAPTMLAAYFIYTGKGVKEAIDFIAKKRPEIHIEPVQMKILQKYAKSLKK